MIYLHFDLPDGGKLHVRLDTIVAFEDRPLGGCTLHLATGETVVVEQSYADAEKLIAELAKQARHAAMRGLATAPFPGPLS